MASLEVRRVTEPQEWENWNSALCERGRDALFSTTHWAETLASAQGCSWTLHLCRSGEELMGGVILLDEGGGGRKRRFV